MKYSNTSESLKDNRDFQKVYQYGKSAANRTLVLYVYPRAEKMRQLDQMPSSWKMAGYTKNRVGISVSKKVGNSVVRHRITRLLRECIRKDDEQITNGKDIVIIARGMANGRSLEEIDGAVLHLCRLHGILK